MDSALLKVDFRSDTVTRPSKAMLEYMMSAQVGDDVFKEDPTINMLQEKVASIFGMEAAIFCPSGTMTNQIAVKLGTHDLSQVICHEATHIIRAETGGVAWNSRASIYPLQGSYGKIKAHQISDLSYDLKDWIPQSTLVVIEQTTNLGGGYGYSLEELQEISRISRLNSLRIHIDGARIFNALEAKDIAPQDIGRCCDTLSVCLSKGLGAPVGSLLVGSKPDIDMARRFRKVMGGGMRQAGYLAAAGIYALDNNVHDLRIDHDRAKTLFEIFSSMDGIRIERPETNIVIIRVDNSAYQLVDLLHSHGILAIAFDNRTIRLVLHRDITLEQFDMACSVFQNLKYLQNTWLIDHS